MKKHIAFLVAAVMLILAACQPSKHGQQGQPETQPSTSVAPTQTTATPTETTKPTETTVPPTTVPATEPTEDLLAVYEEWRAYMESPYGRMYIIFTYDGDGEYPGYGKPIDTSKMVADCLYAVNFETGEVTQITDQACSANVDTSEHIYYVLSEEPTKVYRADHTAENRTLVYESTYGEVTFIDYYGVNENGKLLLCENRNRIIFYDIPTGEVDVLMEAYSIGQFAFSPTSLAFANIGEHISSTEMGATIFWKGQLYENVDSDTYYCFVESEEQWSVESWEQIK